MAEIRTFVSAALTRLPGRRSFSSWLWKGENGEMVEEYSQEVVKRLGVCYWDGWGSGVRLVVLSRETDRESDRERKGRRWRVVSEKSVSLWAWLGLDWPIFR
jgi:hypothetical protein